MSRYIIDLGTAGNPATGDSIRGAFAKVNTNFQEIFSLIGDGTTGLITTSVTNGDLKLQPNGAGIIEIDQLQIDGDSITSIVTNGTVNITGNGTGGVGIEDIQFNGTSLSSSSSSTININENVNVDGDLIVTGTITGNIQITNALTVVGDDSTGTTVSTGETFKIAGTQNITTAVSGDTLTITGPDLTNYVQTNDSPTFGTVTLTGSLLPNTDDTQDIGSSSKRWRDVYVGPGTVKVGTDGGALLEYGSAGVRNGDGGTLIMRVDPQDGFGNTYVHFDESVQMEVAGTFAANEIVPMSTLYGDTTQVSMNGLLITDEYDLSTDSPVVIGTNISNRDVEISPNGTGKVKLTPPTTTFSSGDTTAVLTSAGEGDIEIKTNSGTNSGYIRVSYGTNQDITLAPQGAGTVNVNSSKISNVATPTADTDAATKAYVDAQLSSSTHNITFVGDDSTGTSVTQGETFKIAGGTGITTAVSGDTLTITGISFDQDLNTTDSPTFVALTTNNINVPFNTGFAVNTQNGLGQYHHFTYGTDGVFTSPVGISTNEISTSEITFLDSTVQTTAWTGNNIVTFVGDDSTGTTLNTGETFKIAGTQNITTAVSGDTLTITGPNLSSYLTSETSHADVVVDGDFGSQGIMLRGASAGTYSILTDNSSNWNTAYGWGNHASAGYLTNSTVTLVGDDSTGATLNTGETFKIAGAGSVTTAVSGDTITITGTDTDTTYTAGNGLQLVGTEFSLAENLSLTGTFIQFEGTTDDAFETTLQVTDPTADRLITLPDASGTVALTSDLSSYASATATALTIVGDDSTGTAITLGETFKIAGAGTVTTSVSGDTITITGSGGGVADVVDDTTPQLGGDLDLNSNDITGTGNINITGTITATGDIDATVSGYEIGYRNIPQVSFSVDATLALTDSGKHYYSTSASNLTLTVPTNASVAFETGASINIINLGTGTITVSPASGVTLYFAGSATTGSRTISAYGAGTIQKVASDTWFLVGVGIA